MDRDEQAADVIVEMLSAIAMYERRLRQASAPEHVLVAIGTFVTEAESFAGVSADRTRADRAEPERYLPQHDGARGDEQFCLELRRALNAFLVRYEDEARGAEAVPGQVDLAGINHSEALLDEIERLERAMAEAGCSI